MGFEQIRMQRQYSHWAERIYYITMQRQYSHWPQCLLHYEAATVQSQVWMHKKKNRKRVFWLSYCSRRSWVGVRLRENISEDCSAVCRQRWQHTGWSSEYICLWLWTKRNVWPLYPRHRAGVGRCGHKYVENISGPLCEYQIGQKTFPLIWIYSLQ